MGAAAPNVGEYWTDMHWDGGTLGAEQDAARQALCDVLDATAGALSMFDFPTKGILQVCAVAHDGSARLSGVLWCVASEVLRLVTAVVVVACATLLLLFGILCGYTSPSQVLHMHSCTAATPHAHPWHVDQMVFRA